MLSPQTSRDVYKRQGHGVPVVDEDLVRNADQLDVAFAGVILGGEPVHSAVVAAPVGIVEVPGGEDAVSKGKDGTQVVHQLHFQVFRGGGFQAGGRLRPSER